MAYSRHIIAAIALFAALAFPHAVAATITVSPEVSTNGNYTVSWADYSDPPSTTCVDRTQAYLTSTFNGGNPYTQYVGGTYSASYADMPAGLYSYQLLVT